MAEESGQEKTEDPTPKRLREAREKGDIPRSKELNATALLLAAAAGMLLFGQRAAERIAAMMATNLELGRGAFFDAHSMFQYLGASVKESALAIAGFMVILLLATVLGPIALGGLNFSAQAMQPKFSRLNPLAGIKRMFSLKSLVELLKAFAKFILVAAFAVVLLYSIQPQLFALGSQEVRVAIGSAVELVGWAFLVISSSLIIISLIDVPYQLHDYTQKLKMTLQEVKDEMKNTEGKPEVKGRIRQLQREVAQRQMMQEVPQADVIITNPTHYSVALKYYAGERQAPVVVAKGGDLIALKIREIASEHKVPILCAPALSRALFHTTELDQEIPAPLYQTVAQVLAYVFELRRFQQQELDQAPIQPSAAALQVPESYRFD